MESKENMIATEYLLMLDIILSCFAGLYNEALKFYQLFASSAILLMLI